MRQQVVLDLAIHALKTSSTTATSASSTPFASAPGTLSQDLPEGGDVDGEDGPPTAALFLPLLPVLLLRRGQRWERARGRAPARVPVSPHLRLRGLGGQGQAQASAAASSDVKDAADTSPIRSPSKKKTGDNGSGGGAIPEAASASSAGQRRPKGGARARGTGLEEPLLPLPPPAEG